MDSTIQVALIASTFSFCGVMIGAVISLSVSVFSNWYVSRRQKEQWIRERKAEKETWLRNKLQEVYTNCIYYLSKEGYTGWVSLSLKDVSEIEYYKLRFEGAKLDSENRRELRKWLNLLLLYHPRKDTKEFEDFLTKMREGKLKRGDVVEIAASDPRLLYRDMTRR